MRSILRRWLGIKESQARIAMSINQLGQPIQTPRNYEGFARKGYTNNVTVYRCVSLIAKSCAGIDFEVYSKRRGGEPIEQVEHPLKKLLDHPNPMQGKSSFIESVIGFYGLTGNTFVEAAGPGPKSPPMEIWPVRPDRMKIVPGPKGYPAKYQFTANNVTKEWPVDQVTLRAMVMHMKSFHPLNDWWGLSPLEAAMWALDQNNSGQRWNLALLQNSATPSGVLTVERTDSNPTGSLTDPQFERLKSEVQESYQGSHNAGRPMILEGGVRWDQVSLSPKDMEFLKGKEVTAIDICQAYGVPPEMLGLGAKTFNNYKEARLSFYEETVLPLMDQLVTELNSWLSPMFDDGIFISYNKDDIEALQAKRTEKFSALKDAEFLTVNEKREAAGYAPVESGDVFIIGMDVVEDLRDLSFVSEEQFAEDEEPTEEIAAEIEIEDEDEDVDESGDDDDDDAEKSFKSFNLLNRNERRRSWRAQNARRKRLERNFQRDLAEDFRELSQAIGKAAGESTDPKVQEFAILRAIDDVEPVIEKTLRRHIGYAVREFGQETFANAKAAFPGILEKKSTRSWDDWAKRFIQTRTGNAITTITGTTRKQVRQIVKRIVEESVLEGTTDRDIANELQESFSNLSKARARVIARTETGMASNSASIEAVKALEIPGMVKEWISAGDDRVRDDEEHADHAAMDGVEAPMDEKFTVPPDTMMEGPQDPSGPPEQIINCRCVLGFKSRNNGEL